MEISFKSRDLRNTCEDESQAIVTLGPESAEALKSRLADIRAADTIHEVLAGHPKSGEIDGKECYQFEIGEGRRLIVIPNHQKPRNGTNGATDWKLVRRIKVVSLD